ncbi:MAG: hypothetical protein U1A72_08555 [Sulfuritalea sp.]|nr:hypothetical protein [Sulfuritalea sp.]
MVLEVGSRMAAIPVRLYRLSTLKTFEVGQRLFSPPRFVTEAKGVLNFDGLVVQ